MDWEREHCTIEKQENNVDHDAGKSMSCNACTLPIFSTPFESIQTDSGEVVFLHDECATLPEKLLGHAGHPRQPLILRTCPCTYTCRRCNVDYDGVYYECPDIFCQFRLDLICAGKVRVLHPSHNHRLTVIPCTSAFLPCGACGVLHRNPSNIFYFCHACVFWLHPECASLPSAIDLYGKHRHSLILNYDPTTFWDEPNKCAVCGKYIVESLGVYYCGKCRYYVHIKCLPSDPESFKPVLLQEAKLANVLHFPIKDEGISLMRHIIENTTSGSDEADDHEHPYQIEGKLPANELHEHPLIFHDHLEQLSMLSRVCNACIQSISPPFYSCSICPDFLIHSCCAHLPSKIKHPFHEHSLYLSPKTPKSFFICYMCIRPCNGFSYSCRTCDYATMEAACALLPLSITHEFHGKTHILYMSFTDFIPNNCGDFQPGAISFYCSNCSHFLVHGKCAVLPRSIRHKYDEHPLMLTSAKSATIGNNEQFCEICEERMHQTEWYYSCNLCDQWFHRECIPSVDHLSGIKFGVTVHVNCHACPLTLVREDTVVGYRCDYCREIIRFETYDRFEGSDSTKEYWAYECSDCYFRIHGKCAKKCLLQVNN